LKLKGTLFLGQTELYAFDRWYDLRLIQQQLFNSLKVLFLAWSHVALQYKRVALEQRWLITSAEFDF
jgi:hypothetical protein